MAAGYPAPEADKRHAAAPPGSTISLTAIGLGKVATVAKETSRAYRLEAGEQPSSGMRRIALARAELALERLDEAERADDPAPCIHGVRKDLKKLRAAVRLLRRELGDDLYRAENERYRDAGRRLAPTRDAEVKLETLDSLRERFPERVTPAASREWREALVLERDRAVAEARAGDSIAAARLVLELGRDRIAGWPLEADSWKLVGPGLSRSYRRGRKGMRRAAREPGDESLHEWRKRAKDLWYHLRILRECVPSRLHGATDRADELADRLGEHHDLAVLREDLFGRELPTAMRPALVEAIVERQEELAGEAFELGEALYAEKPKAFRRTMHGGWRKWRS
jgi:CHAD domain-containing protein